jgi:hypothetical protein
MKLKHYFAIILVFGIIFGLNSYLGAEEQKTKDGKTIYIDAKCGNCHAITVEKIIPPKKPAGKVPPPDLSDIGLKLKADFMVKYLKKEEALNDKKHLIAFKGEDADLQILATWLESLKTAPPAAAE